ncbi:MAG: hypothetical protein AB7N71_10430, partial [Phycisphaerae bacterium]
VFAHLDSIGVPLGVPSNGKGDEADGSTSNNPNQACDSDQDGLIDMYDADNNGNGIVDEFDGMGGVGGEPDNADIRASFFMNLKIDEAKADLYYSGSPAEIEDALANNTIITFEIIPQPGSTKTITSVGLFPKTAPAYIEGAKIMVAGEMGVELASWADLDYQFMPGEGGRWEAFVSPQALINAGDTFTVIIAFDDDSTLIYSRMINFVFTSIPKLTRVGTPATLAAYTGATPIAFDGAQDLVVEFEPPRDEDGNFITGVNYFFEIFYNGDDGQLNGMIDGAATWTSPITHWRNDTHFLEVPADALGDLSTDGTYTFTLPKEVFPSTVQLIGGGSATVNNFKIDIAAQSAGNNAAIMLGFEKL